MRSSTVYEPEGRLSEPPANLEITNWALRDSTVSCILIVIGVFLVTAIVASVADSWFVAMIVFLALNISLRRMWVPIRFNIGPRGIAETAFRRKRRIAWSSIRSCEIQGQGVFLCPSAEITPLTATQGHYIAWRDEKENLIAILRYYLNGQITQALNS